MDEELYKELPERLIYHRRYYIEKILEKLLESPVKLSWEYMMDLLHKSDLQIIKEYERLYERLSKK